MQSVGDVVVDGFGEGIGALKHHSHSGAHIGYIGAGSVDILAVQGYFTGDAALGDQIIHAVKTAQQGGFTASRRTDESGDLFIVNWDVNIFEHMFVAEPQVHVVCADMGRAMWFYHFLFFLML
jgi:hypothetical protein